MSEPTIAAVAEAARAKRNAEASKREAAAASNRERVRRWSPEFARMCDQLREFGMFGRMVKLEITE